MAQPTDVEQTADTDELVRLSQVILDAIRTRDRSALGAVLLPDFVQIDEHGNRVGKDAFIAAVEAGEFHIEQLSFDMLSVERFGQTAIVCGVQRARVRLPAGEHVEGRTAFTDVFIHGAAGWQLRVATSAELSSS